MQSKGSVYKKRGRGGVKSPASPCMNSMDKCDTDIPITAAGRSLNVSPSAPLVPLRRPARSAAPPGGLALVLRHPLSPPPPSPRGCSVFPAISGPGGVSCTAATFPVQAKVCLRSNSAPCTQPMAPVTANRPLGCLVKTLAGGFRLLSLHRALLSTGLVGMTQLNKH